MSIDPNVCMVSLEIGNIDKTGATIAAKRANGNPMVGALLWKDLKPGQEIQLLKSLQDYVRSVSADAELPTI